MKKRRERGLALLSFSVALMVLVPLAGLGVDSAMLYITKERVNTAVLLAARSAAKTAGTNADATAQRVFDANFPKGMLGVEERTVTCKDGSIRASVQAPTYFMRMLRYQNVTVEAVAIYQASASPASDTARN